MLKNHKIIVIISLVIAVVGGLFLIPRFDTVGNHWKGYEIIPYVIEGRSYQLLVADTEEKRATGLMHVTEKDMKNIDGMIFTFTDMNTRTFWNKNTNLDLTVYWIANDQVVGKDHLPSQQAKPDTTITSPQPVDTVVEIVNPRQER